MTTQTRRGRPAGFTMSDDQRALISASVQYSPKHAAANPNRSKIQVGQIVPYWIRAKRSARPLAEIRAASVHAKRDDELESMLVRQRCSLDGFQLTLTSTRTGDPENGTARCKGIDKSHTFTWSTVDRRLEVTAN